MTANDMKTLIGEKILVKVDRGFQVPMMVLDAKSAWGRLRLLVEPCNGKGQAWIDADLRVEKA